MMDESLSRYGAVETPEEGRRFAAFLAAHRDEADGVIVALANFGDENGALYALRDAGVPILVQAYPDEIGKMDFSHRRDAVCGKIAMCNVLRQAGIKFSLTQDFAVDPKSKAFAEDLRLFAATCRIVKGMRRLNVAAVGARTTAFKTVRFDEIAYQRKGVGIETLDLSYVFSLMEKADATVVAESVKALKRYADFGKWPSGKVDALARLAIALKKIKDDLSIDAFAIRCWDEFQHRWGIAPCVVMAMLNSQGVPAACEMDVNNAVAMKALSLAADGPVGLFDVNNNYGKAKDRMIFFHCSALPGEMLKGKGVIGEHLMFRKAFGPGTGVGIFGGSVRPMPLTVASMKTEDGSPWAFVTTGKVTTDNVEKGFFGTGFVFRPESGDANAMLNYMARNGYRHHVAFVEGDWSRAVAEALSNYLEYPIDEI
jgi:L-fucose isomerase-like protein